MSFNLGITAGASQSSVKKLLEGNQIHEVTFDGCEAADLKDGQFHVIRINFSNEDGSFSHTIWEPHDTDMEDTQGIYGPNPSNVKSMMLTIKHLIDAVNPELAKAIDNKEKDLDAPNWEALRKLVVRATQPGVGTKTKIKLLKNKRGEATFPGFVATYNRAGQLCLRTNFIGDKIMFTSKELQNINKQETATPTAVAPVRESLFNADGTPSTTINDDFLDDLDKI